jgi:hypothetical protein
MTDRIFTSWLGRQFEEGMALAAESDLLHLVPVGAAPYQRYIADFRCTGLVRTDAGEIVEADRFLVGVWFPDQYLREADPFTVLTWLGPREVFHPNIGDRAPFICVGRIVPGTSLVDLLYRCFEVITYNRVTVREDDALNKTACAWARCSQRRFPVDLRPLKRPSAGIDASASSGAAPLELEVVEAAEVGR